MAVGNRRHGGDPIGEREVGFAGLLVELLAQGVEPTAFGGAGFENVRTILASGNVVHNLREIQWDQPNTAFDWAERFDDAVVAQLADTPGDILKVREHPDYARAVPTPDHFVPLLYLAGLAAAEDTRPEPIVRGYSMGSISMTCHALGVNLPVDTEAEDAATLPRDVPADQTNI